MVACPSTGTEADAADGRSANTVASAGEFHRRVGMTGVVLSKMDSDTRGGVALSVVGVLGVPILFNGTGELVEDLEQFNSDRMVSRILGMGDILGLVERAERVGLDEKNQAISGNSRVSEFNLTEFRKQLCLIKKMGPLDQLVGLLPGFKGNLIQSDGVDSKRLTRMVAIIDSMTYTTDIRESLNNYSLRLELTGTLNPISTHSTLLFLSNSII